jgi:hypothetical protein
MKHKQQCRLCVPMALANPVPYSKPSAHTCTDIREADTAGPPKKEEEEEEEKNMGKWDVTNSVIHRNHTPNSINSLRLPPKNICSSQAHTMRCHSIKIPSLLCTLPIFLVFRRRHRYDDSVQSALNSTHPRAGRL